jgi:signal transduction histidine kinase
MKEKKIKRKVIILNFITLIPVSLLRILDIREDLKFSIEAELISSQDFAEAINISFMNFIEKTWTSQHMIGRAILANPSWTDKDIELYLESILPEDKFMLGYSWVDTDGTVIASTNQQLRGTSLDYREYIKRITAGEEKVVSNLITAYDGKQIIVAIARAVKSNNELKGIIVNVLNVQDIQKIFPMKRLGDRSTFGLIDKTATLVYRNNNNDIPFENRTVSKDSPSIKALQGEIVKTHAKYSGFYGNETMGIDYPIEEIGWSCFVTTYVGSLLTEEVTGFKQDLLLFICIFIVSLAAATLFARKHVNSIIALKTAASEVAKGNMEYKLEVSKKDDLAEVKLLFNNMIQSLKKEKEELEEYNSLKTQFLSTVSHELKTPLNIILGCIQIMEKIDFSNLSSVKVMKKYIMMQKQNSYRLLRLINNIIDINKSEVNQMRLSLSNGDIVSVVEDITLSVVEYTNLKGIQLTFDTEVEEKIIAFDHDAIERIMLNLLSNSIKFTESGGTIDVNIFDKGEKLQISVKDSGIGIPEDKQELIFERFIQLDNSLRRKSEGSGIGLSLVKYLVELHGGAIWVNSEYGAGSDFIIELPNKTTSCEVPRTTEKSISNVERINIEFSDIYM